MRIEPLPHVLARHAVTLRAIGLQIVRPGITEIQRERMSNNLLAISGELVDVAGQVLNQMEARREESVEVTETVAREILQQARQDVVDDAEAQAQAELAIPDVPLPDWDEDRG